MRKKIGLFLNLLIIALEIVGLFLSIDFLKDKMFLYYTQDSNLLLLIATLLYVLNYNKKENKVIGLLKYGATLSVLVTFLVVIFILGPTTNLTYNWLLFDGANLYYHTVCPILAFITFVFFDKISVKGYKDNLWGLLFTIIYSIVLVTLNLLRIVDGPYPFLHPLDNPIYISIMWFVVIVGGAFVLAMLLEMAKNKIQTE